ncbi:MAG TPA: ribosome silencing factor [Candidatus Borkfalkia excrementigallinarum]|mgnify:CR=1 FL=1|uniref:Ribosomal silencing factor RsfS n=1 Tax=Candidatus Borkfalkia excrementigallinarum TaxID=2838506 RepID=A0A9D1ZWT8_9FIRM|nr:ribosome silencing factor [Candidatus Borkfalkia excrementigallinarum]
METKRFTEEICKFLSSKKAEDILTIDVREKTVLCDYFIIASGRSSAQVKALCENLEEKFSKEGIEPRRTEGVRDGRWGVIDYGDVIVHIFNDESRLFYHLERLWEDGENVVRYHD